MDRPVTFGTSGWRGVIADDFTFERVRLVVAAVAAHLWETGEAARGVLVAYDGRFAGEEFASLAAEELTARGIDAHLADRMVPTPAVSRYILAHHLGGAINFTASHNPGRWQGLKFNPSWGGSALPPATRRIEELCRLYQTSGVPAAGAVRGRISAVDPAPPYLQALRKLVRIDRIAEGGPLILYDALFGAGAGYLDRLLEEEGGKVEVMHGWRDPLFGGEPPDPNPERLRELSSWAQQRGALGLATDGDADRFGIVGQEGEHYSANEVLVLLADYLIGVRKVKGDLARSIATTTRLEEVAASFGRACRETPVGFKYIGEMIARGELAIGGEESAGLSMAGHIPEKDGILACLLVAEAVTVLGQPLSHLMRVMDRRYGPRFSRRVDLSLADGFETRLRGLLSAPPRAIGHLTAGQVLSTDGTKWVFGPRSWALLRLSGTEPVARLYLESDDPETTASIEREFRGWILG
jgi:phosphoglucomutase